MSTANPRPTRGDGLEAGTRAQARRQTSADEIAAVALGLVDREGLDRLSMRRLAEELGIGTMTLYGYFRDKDELLDALVDAAAAEHPLPPPGLKWNEQLRFLMVELRRGLTEHPSVIALRLRRPLLSAGALRMTEVGMKALEEAGYSRAAAARAFRSLFIYTFGYVAFSAPEMSDELRRQGRSALATLEPREYPTLIAAQAELPETLGGDEQFEFGLDRLLDGLKAAAPNP